MAPMTRGRADDATGVPHPLTGTYYAQRATAGLIVTEGLWPHVLGKGGPGIPGLVTDAHVAGWREVTGAVHAAGGTIFAQLWHVGRMTHPLNLPGRATPRAPSAVRIEGEPIYTGQGDVEHVTPRAMTTAEAEATIADFAAAARNAIRAGFDGVEVHGANGYLVQQFLAENTNRRTDRFGGSRTGRLRFAVDVVEAVAAEVGPERVGLRISPHNPENEIAEEDPEGTYRTLVDTLDRLGLAYLHVIERGAYGALADLRPRWSGTLIGNFNGPHPTSQKAARSWWRRAWRTSSPSAATSSPTPTSRTASPRAPLLPRTSRASSTAATPRATPTTRRLSSPAHDLTLYTGHKPASRDVGHRGTSQKASSWRMPSRKKRSAVSRSASDSSIIWAMRRVRSAKPGSA